MQDIGTFISEVNRDSIHISIDISNFRIANIGTPEYLKHLLDVIRHSKALRTLEISHYDAYSSELLGEILEAVAANGKLTGLSLLEFDLDKLQMSRLAQLLVPAIRSNPSLKDFRLLPNNRLRNAEIPGIHFCDILGALESCSGLEALILDIGTCRDQQIEDIAQLVQQSAHLQHLEISWSENSSECLGTLLAAIRVAASLKTVKLSIRGMHFENTLQVFEASDKVTTLELYCCHFEGVAFTRICNLLRGKSLKNLVLNECHNAVDANELSLAIQESNVLESLELSWCGIFDAGVMRVCNAVARTKALKSLTIADEILDAAATALAAAITQNKTLTSLSIACGLGTEVAAVERLCTAIAASESIEHLSIYNEPIEQQAAISLSSALTPKSKLKSLNFRCGNFAKPEVSKMLIGAIYRAQLPLTFSSYRGPFSSPLRHVLNFNKELISERERLLTLCLANESEGNAARSNSSDNGETDAKPQVARKVSPVIRFMRADGDTAVRTRVGAMLGLKGNMRLEEDFPWLVTTPPPARPRP
jgi:hypothetical protein